MSISTMMDLCSSVKSLRASPDYSTGRPRWHSPWEPVQWPAAAIPVEVFEIITSHLSRADVKSLRLVCKEFETKASSQYFKNVVVPFRSELYSQLARDQNGTLINPTSRLFSEGTRIFEDFGPHIRRFALSLELEEEALAFPPIKPSQEAVSAFWGIYRWPHENYHRYTDLAGLEQTADETEGMRAALRCLTRVSTLGLCCDAGLGYLCGPDQIARNNTVVHPVFQNSNWRNSRARTKSAPIVTIGDINDASQDHRGRPYRPIDKCRLKILERMVGDAGYAGYQVDEVVDLLLETEDATLGNIAFDDRLPTMHFHQVERPGTQLGSDSADTLISVAQVASVETRSYPLAPASLNGPQKEMLLELEWAHRAMIQSYILGITDNAAGGHFDNVTTLNIAKIPSSHTYIFYQREFWSALPNLTSVSLGVVADWRRVTKTAASSVQDTSISPVTATEKVFRLLNEYIGVQETIQSLHFEWICGGEFAPSCHQRNQYVLPAPFVEFPEMMATAAASKVGKDKRLLRLPHIKRLSLKNCWFAPHIMIQELRDFALSSLEVLEFESVSVSGPPLLSPADAQAVQAMALLPTPAAAIAAMAASSPTSVTAETGNPGSAAAAASDDMASGVLAQLKWYSWPGIIRQFSPFTKVRNIFADHDTGTTPISHVIPDTDRLASEKSSYKLRSLSFKSCGYILLDHPLFVMRNMLPGNIASQLVGSTAQPRAELSPLMQQCKDRLLGRVMPYISPDEEAVLEDTFGLRIGWEGVYERKIIEHAVSDGVEQPGAGRFSGVVGRNRTATRPTHLFHF